jgi:molybdate transport system permease protein
VLLLDEPFSALDMPVRLELRRELRRLQKETGLATVLVTHDPEEAAFLSDELIVLADGAVLQSGSSRSVFSRPASAEVARLLGVENMNVATMSTSSTIDVGGGLLPVPVTEIAVGAAVWWSIAPERVRVSSVVDDPSSDTADALLGTVVDVADMGSTYDIFVHVVDGVEVLARTRGALEVEVGSRCRIELDRSAISLWEAPSDLTGRSVIAAATH